MTSTPDQGRAPDVGTASGSGDLADPAAAVKPPEEWVTGDEPATAAQLSYLQTLARDVGEPVPEGLSKAQASELIDRLRRQSPRVDAAAEPAEELPASARATRQAPVQEPPAQEPPD